MQQWAEEDDVALPHRLLALIDRPTYQHLSRAHVLDPDDQAVTHSLAVILIRDVDFSASAFGEVDLTKLEEAELVIATLQGPAARRSLGAKLDGLRERVTDQAEAPPSRLNPL